MQRCWSRLTLALQRKLNARRGFFHGPGVLQRGSGTGPGLLGQNTTPPLEAAPERNLGAPLEAWVEHGRAPNSVIGGYSSDPAREGPGAHTQAR